MDPYACSRTVKTGAKPPPRLTLSGGDFSRLGTVGFVKLNLDHFKLEHKIVFMRRSPKKHTPIRCHLSLTSRLTFHSSIVLFRASMETCGTTSIGSYECE